MNVYPLDPSPIFSLRAKYGLTQPAAAERLGISLAYLKVLEMRSRTVPAHILEVIDSLLGPPTPFTQVTIWEALAQMDREPADRHPSGQDGAPYA